MAALSGAGLFGSIESKGRWGYHAVSSLGCSPTKLLDPRWRAMQSKCKLDLLPLCSRFLAFVFGTPIPRRPTESSHDCAERQLRAREWSGRARAQPGQPSESSFLTLCAEVPRSPCDGCSCLNRSRLCLFSRPLQVFLIFGKSGWIGECTGPCGRVLDLTGPAPLAALLARLLLRVAL